jgi:dolichyl-phosphate-mannose-protein mannosyltransferase
VIRLDTPSFQYFDEYFSAFTANQWLQGNRSFYNYEKNAPDLNEGAYLRYHPPTGVLLIALGIKIFGDNPWGWRLMSVGAGLIVVGMTYGLTFGLSSRVASSLLAAFLVSIESLLFFHSRVGTVDIFLVAAILVATHLSLKWYRTQTSFGALLIGLSWGLALSIKWSALIPLVVIFGYFWLGKVKLGQLLLWFLVTPCLVYTLVFSLTLSVQPSFLVDVHQTILGFHLGEHQQADQVYQINPEVVRSWWEWPFFYRPVRYFFQYVITPDSGALSTINIAPNLAITFLLPLAVISASFFRKRLVQDFEVKTSILSLIQALFLIQWLIWIFSPRPTLLWYFLPAIPYGVITLSIWLVWFWQQKKTVLVTAYILLCLGVFVFHYPWLTAFPVPERWFEILHLGFPAE